MSTLRLNTGDVNVSSSGNVLVTGGVGSCIVVCVWDKRLRTGGMAHMCMPKSSGEILFPGRAPDTAIPYIITQMEKKGSFRASLYVTIVGGGNMFSAVEFESSGDIGFQITNSTKKFLQVYGLTLGEVSLGGRFGRGVKFCLTSGLVDVNFTNGESITLRNVG